MRTGDKMTNRLSLMITEDMHARLDALETKRAASRSTIVRTAVEAYLKKEEGRK